MLFGVSHRILSRGLQTLMILLLVTFTQVRGEQTTPKANYRQANKFSMTNLLPMMYSTSVNPNWIGKSDTFWYSYRTSAGQQFWKVDPKSKAKTPLFNRDKLGIQLSELSRKPVDSINLPISRTQVNSDGSKLTFVYYEMSYEYDLKSEKLISKGKASPAPRFPGKGFGTGRRRADADFEDEIPPQEKTEDKTKGPGSGGPARGSRAASPDRKSYLFTKNNNLYLAETGKEKDAVQLSKDGTDDYTFQLFSGFTPSPKGRSPVTNRSIWSKDSNFFYSVRQDSRGIKELFVIDSIATPRPTLEKYKYPMPGEDAIRKMELHIGSKASKSLVRIPQKWRDEMYMNLHWGKEPSELRFLRMDRVRRNLDFCSLDMVSQVCRVLIAEGFDSAPIEYQPPTYLENSNEMIWWSEKSGWGHYYLYDRNGKFKNAITSGSWRASRIVKVDEKNRTLYFQANGREKGENIYYNHMYSVKLDGSNLTLLDPGDASHNSELSPSNQLVVDNSTRVDRIPESVLRDHKGIKIMDLEKTDVSRLREYGWKPAETFVVKAGDGVTDLYGNMWKPFDFDPNKKYPIISYVYPGPQQEGVTHTFSAYSSYMQLAQLGFVVIQVGHRGGAPTRSKAYASYGYYNLRDYGLADKKLAIEQLAAKHSWIDIKKVGIYGHSGGGFMSAAAMLQKPYNDFFTAAVASAGNHDNNIYGYYWAERYHGMKEIPIKEEIKDGTKRPTDEKAPVAPPITRKTEEKKTKTPVAPPPPKVKFEIKVPTNAELAANLKGALMLVHGEIDNNVHPANTMRLVDALIKANKRFDLLIIPGKRHGFGDANPYFTRRMWEFFAAHLLGDHRSGADLLDQTNE